LIDANAAVDTVNNGGRTALMFACISGHHEYAQVLIEAQANVELTKRDGQR
jgi:ankyrin repeat protein